MTEYLIVNGQAIPIVKIGRGSSSFFANLVRSYIKNYPVVNLYSNSHKINLAVWVIYQLQQEFAVNDIQVMWGVEGVSLAFNVYSDQEITETRTFEQDETMPYVKIGKGGDIESLSRVINKTDACTLIAAGGSCQILFQLLVYAYSKNFISSEIEIIRTHDAQGKEKAGVSVYIYRFHMYQNAENLYGVQGE